MKILQVNCVYQKGSTGKIVHDIHTRLLAQGHESIVCYGRGDVILEPGVYKTCGEFYSHVNHFWANLTGITYGGCFFSTNRLISIIQKEKPDVVHLHCINGYFVNIYRLVAWLKKNHIKTVLTLHAEFMYTGGCSHSVDCEQWSMTAKGCGSVHCPQLKSTESWFLDRTGTMWRKMNRAFQGEWPELTVVAVSDWLSDRAKRSRILEKKQHCVINNGINTDIFHYQPEKRESLRRSQGWENKYVILHVTADYRDPIKGGAYLTELSKRFDPEKYVLAVVDGANGTAPEGFRGVYWGRAQSQEELAALYCAADVMTITSSRESFPTTCLEALCCGTPIACFDFHNGSGEPSFPTAFSRLSPFGDVEMLQANIMELLKAAFSSEKISAEMACVFSKRAMADKYIRLYE